MSKPFTLLGLTGRANAGKDTVADILVSHSDFIKLAFADPLYQEISDAFNIEVAQLKRRETKEHPLTALAIRKCDDTGFIGRMMQVHYEQGLVYDLDAPRSPRQILQWWGTEYRRHQSERYWVSLASAKISYHMRERLATKFVITDCRFHDEVQMVRESFGGRIWQVTRPGFEAPPSQHISDTSGEAFQPEAVIVNDNDIHHLRALTVGAWLMHDTGMSAHDIVRMGFAHVAQAGEEWKHHVPAGLTLHSPQEFV